MASLNDLVKAALEKKQQEQEQQDEGRTGDGKALAGRKRGSA